MNSIPVKYEIRYHLSFHPREAAEGIKRWYVYTAGTHDSKGAFDSREAAEVFIRS